MLIDGQHRQDYGFPTAMPLLKPSNENDNPCEQ
jgi:hypothetical protein